MRILKRCFDFYIYSSIHTAIAIYAFVCITQITLGLPVNENLNKAIFFGTVLGYNFLKYISVFNFKTIRKRKYFDIGIVTFLAILGLFYFFFKLNLAIQNVILKIGILVLIYPYLRRFALYKIFLVSFCVSIVTVYLPAFYLKSLTFDFYITLIQRLLLCLSLLIPFEIKDSKTDNLNMKTIPQEFGINSAKLFGILLVIPFIVIEFLKTNFNYLVLPIGILVSLFIHNSSIKRSKYYTSFWVESLPILWLILLVLLK